VSPTIACLDMAGTTVRDDGVVLDAFRSAISGRGLSAAEYDQAMKDVQATMGQSKIEVFRRLLVTRDLPQTRRSRSTTRPPSAPVRSRRCPGRWTCWPRCAPRASGSAC